MTAGTVQGGTGPVVVLIGPPGAGKTVVGQALARILGVRARDTDADIEAAQQRTVGEIFVEDGEPAFRELERTAVERALAEHRGVLAVGGGAVLDPRTEALLQDHPTVVFLDVQITDAARRIGFNRDRPLLLGNPRARWTSLMEARRPIYERIAGSRVETDGRTPDEVAGDVAALLERVAP